MTEISAKDFKLEPERRRRAWTGAPVFTLPLGRRHPCPRGWGAYCSFCAELEELARLPCGVCGKPAEAVPPPEDTPPTLLRCVAALPTTLVHDQCWQQASAEEKERIRHANHGRNGKGGALDLRDAGDSEKAPRRGGRARRKPERARGARRSD